VAPCLHAKERQELTEIHTLDPSYGHFEYFSSEPCHDEDPHEPEFRFGVYRTDEDGHVWFGVQGYGRRVAMTIWELESFLERARLNMKKEFDVLDRLGEK
jgi:hypothetical protein